MSKITISIPDDIADKANQAVQAGLATSVSAWFTDLARREPDWVAAAAILAALTDEAGVTEADMSEAAAALDAAEAAATERSLGGTA